MFALTQPPPKPPLPEIIRGLVVQITYDTTKEGRLTPFNPEDPEHDLMFRGWYANGFATRTHGATEIHDAHLQFGWRSRILPGVAEKQASGWEFHPLH